MPNGIFLVRFKTLEMQQKALMSDQLMFDNKPVIIHEWSADAELVKQEITNVPIWIKLIGIELKFWGKNALKKISGIIGEFMRCDEATEHKTLLNFAKILVKVPMSQSFPDFIEFKDEKGSVQKVKVEYDWLPITCTQCKGMGHVADQCRKTSDKVKVKPKVVTKQVWRPVVKPVAGQATAPSPMKATAVPKRTESPVLATPNVNGTVSTPVRILTRMNSHNGIESLPGKATFMEVFNSAIHKSVQMAKGGLSSGRTRVESKHKGGRVWLLWNPQAFDVSIEDITSQTIHAFVKDKINNREFWFTCVYGFNDQTMRGALWKRLKQYNDSSKDAWALGGDFNNVLGFQERIGGEVTIAEIQPFQECVDYCQLLDIKAVGS
ncbi:uncharacterized protein LOC141595388 [Silene latifolia]|uniref:uncharacterized protein LOC141595388 n=1 Tax=Silene latifolia TaxID=37657 RepID=UPI003D772965